MAGKYKSIRGTRDILPDQSEKWQYAERIALETAAAYGVRQIRIPTFEKTELFTRSVGETSDVAQKEMYSFEKGREKITLRPEGTAGTMRAVLENNMLSDVLPLKLCYIISCFRHDNPQAGRYREFHQFGVEYIGSSLPVADAEVICLAQDFLAGLGVTELRLEINSIGCPDCRPAYNEALKAYYVSKQDKLCKTCLERLEKNPLRLLDCKEEGCRSIAADAPRITGHLCGGCGGHFDGLKRQLDAIGLSYYVNPFIVRGLDYYTKTVFEFISPHIGAQSTVCGGGRYDGLAKELGGPDTPALGFALGIDRLLLVMEASGAKFPRRSGCDIYIGSMGEAENIRSLVLASALRREGFSVLCDEVGRSVKAQMRYADKINAEYSCILGQSELEEGKIRLKRMNGGEEAELALDAGEIIKYLRSCGHSL